MSSNNVEDLPLLALDESQLVLRESFDGGTISPLWGEPMFLSDSHYTPNTSEVSISSNIFHSASFAAHYYTVEGTNERTSIQLRMSADQMHALFGGEPEELYVEWWEYFAKGYCFPTSSQKLFRAGFDDSAFPASKKEYGVLASSSNSNLSYAAFCGLWGDSSDCSVDIPGNTGVSLPLGEWAKIGIWIKLNTPGEADGFIRFYLNNSVIRKSENANLRGNNTRGLNYFWIGGNYSNLNGGKLACSGHRYIDDIAVYRTGSNS